jgi:hypothetical protein
LGWTTSLIVIDLIARNCLTLTAVAAPCAPPASLPITAMSSWNCDVFDSRQPMAFECCGGIRCRHRLGRYLAEGQQGLIDLTAVALLHGIAQDYQGFDEMRFPARAAPPFTAWEEMDQKDRRSARVPSLSQERRVAGSARTMADGRSGRRHHGDLAVTTSQSAPYRINICRRCD